MQRNGLFNDDLIFVMEQWLALLVGIACLAECLWAVLAGHKAFALQHSAHLGRNMLGAIVWFLAIAAGVLGVTLMRFAFHKRGRPEDCARSANRNLEMVKDK